MPNRSKTDIVERVKLLEEEVYPSGTNTPDTATAGEDGKLDLVNTGEIDIGKLVSALDVSGYDITGVGELESDSLNTSSIGNIPGKGVSQPLFNSLSAGYAVGIRSDGEMVSVDPTDSAYNGDSDALNAVNDYLTTNTVTGGSIYIPPTRADGTNWVIDDTVYAGKTDKAVVVNLYFIGFNRSETAEGGARVETSINDGSPMFRVTGDSDADNNVSGGEVIGGQFDLRDNDAVAFKFSHWSGFDAHFRGIRNFTGVGIKVSTACFEWSIAGTVRPDDQQNTKTATCLELVNEDGSRDPDDGYIHLRTGSANSESILVTANSGDIHISGKYEDAYGRGHIDIANSGGSVVLTDECYLSNTNNGAHAVYHDGGGLVANAGKIEGADGDGIYCTTDAADFYISPNIRYAGVSGDRINIQTEAPTGIGIVPYPDAVVGVESATVNYPTDPWTRLYYTDGWQLIRNDTATISAGATETVEEFAGELGEQMRVQWFIRNDPGSSVEVQQLRGVNSTDDKHALLFEEQTGNADVDIAYTILRRR